MKKMLEIERCSGCPYFENDPNNHIDFWGKDTCIYDENALKEVGDTSAIPSWCPLPDAPEE